MKTVFLKFGAIEDKISHWVNDIEYFYGAGRRKSLILHMVVCDESWEEIDESTGEVVKRHLRYVWVSDLPFCRKKVHKRCNLGGRHRGGN